MPKVKILVSLGYVDEEGRVQSPAPKSIIDVSEFIAEDLVRAGHAEYVSPPKISRTKKNTKSEDAE